MPPDLKKVKSGLQRRLLLEVWNQIGDMPPRTFLHPSTPKLTVEQYEHIASTAGYVAAMCLKYVLEAE